jgi:hypothetical protein
MSVANVSAKAKAETDRLGKRILDSIVAIESLRTEKVRLVEQVKSLKQTNLMLESEIRSLKLALENERAG